MNVQAIMWSRWSMGMRKALTRLVPAGTAKGRTDQGKPDGAISALNSPTRRAADFWSDFERDSSRRQCDDRHSADEKTEPPSILVPFDFTASSCAALDCALRMAQKGKARVTLLHAIHLNLSPYGPANVALIKQSLRQEAEAKMSQLAALARRQNIALDYVVDEGPASAVISDFIKEQTVDLVVVGRHQHRGLGWFGRRNTAEKVVREAGCPVLVLQTEDLERILS